MSIATHRLYDEMRAIRGKDRYPDERLEACLVEKTYPRTTEELTLRLSNVVAAFYGFTLEHVGERFGWQAMDDISRTLFRELGRLKTREALEREVEVPRDSRAPGLVFVTAVFTASPEYNFEFVKYAPAETVLRVCGVSRYDRIAKRLDIEQYLTWPVLTPFFEGVADELGIECRIGVDRRSLGPEGQIDCHYTFSTA
ncbi:MAG: hypothetical protein NFCOHLIN_01634 [Gammaproteobacteria bacterium]|nr:hypothetical protein [Gammaproteobacteria bacterium]